MVLMLRIALPTSAYCWLTSSSLITWMVLTCQACAIHGLMSTALQLVMPYILGHIFQWSSLFHYLASQQISHSSQLKNLLRRHGLFQHRLCSTRLFGMLSQKRRSEEQANSMHMTLQLSHGLSPSYLSHIGL